MKYIFKNVSAQGKVKQNQYGWEKASGKNGRTRMTFGLRKRNREKKCNFNTDE